MKRKKRILVATGGGDCPGLNAVIRAIVRKATGEYNWEVVGSIDAFNGVLMEPMELRIRDFDSVAGIHQRGGTIIGTTNRGGPFQWPVLHSDGTYTYEDRSDEMIRRLQYQGIEAVINIGGDGSQRISQRLFEKGLNIIGVPKTIDNDLAATDFTFGYQTALEIATDAVDKLVTTAESHKRMMVLEVMGRDAGWIALGTAIAGGAHVALIPEIPYKVESIIAKIEERTRRGRGHVIVVVAEGGTVPDPLAALVEQASDEDILPRCARIIAEARFVERGLGALEQLRGIASMREGVEAAVALAAARAART